MDQLHDQPMSFWPSYYDPDGDSVSVSGYTQPAHGSLTFDSQSQNFTYTPAVHFTGEDSFSYSVSDGIATTTATVALTIYNNAPTLDDMTVSLLHDQPTSFWPMYSDPDGDTVTLSGYSQSAHGSVTDDGMGGLIYTPAAGYVGSDSLTVSVTDGVDTTTATVYLTVTNQAPTVYDSNLGLIHDRYYSIWPTLSDPDGDSVTVSSWTSTAHGTLTYDSVSQYFSYMPDTGYTGADSFSYTVTDGAASSTASVYLTITDQAPMLDNGGFTIAENSPNGSYMGTFMGTDADGDPLTYSITAGNTDGAFAIDPNSGAITVSNSAALDFETTPSFSLTVQATDGVKAVSALFAVSLMDVNDMPVANDDGTFNVLHGDMQVLDLLANDTDGENDPLQVVLVHYPTHGSVSFDSDIGSYVYMADPEYTGADSFTYQAFDGTAYSNEATVSITIINQPVSIAAVGPYKVLVNHSLPLTQLLNPATDPDGDPLYLEIVSSPTHGQLIARDDGFYDYQPDPDYTGSDSFTYKATDLNSESGLITVGLEVVDEDFIVNPDYLQTTQDTELVFTDSDLLANDMSSAGSSPQLVSLANPSHGSLTQDANGNWHYLPNAGFTGIDTMLCSVTNGTIVLQSVVQFTVAQRPFLPPTFPQTVYNGLAQYIGRRAERGVAISIALRSEINQALNNSRNANSVPLFGSYLSGAPQTLGIGMGISAGAMDRALNQEEIQTRLGANFTLLQRGLVARVSYSLGTGPGGTTTGDVNWGVRFSVSITARDNTTGQVIQQNIPFMFYGDSYTNTNISGLWGR